MRKDDLESLYNTYHIEELCFMLGCTAPTLYNRLDELGIARKGQGKGKRRRKKLIIDEDER